MNYQFVISSMYALIILGSILSIIFTLGVIWRVEKKLDTAYKLFLAAIIFFTLSEITGLFVFRSFAWITHVSLGSRLFFVIFFLFGMLEMRAMIRKIDGEKSEGCA